MNLWQRKGDTAENYFQFCLWLRKIYPHNSLSNRNERPDRNEKQFGDRDSLIEKGTRRAEKFQFHPSSKKNNNVKTGVTATLSCLVLAIRRRPYLKSTISIVWWLCGLLFWFFFLLRFLRSHKTKIHPQRPQINTKKKKKKKKKKCNRKNYLNCDAEDKQPHTNITNGSNIINPQI